MSKALSIHRGARIARMDCGHTIDRIRPFTWDYGDEVDCPTCAQIAAARTEIMIATGLAEHERGRREALEWARDIVIAIDVTTDVQGALNAILDKIEEKP